MQKHHLTLTFATFGPHQMKGRNDTSTHPLNPIYIPFDVSGAEPRTGYSERSLKSSGVPQFHFNI